MLRGLKKIAYYLVAIMMMEGDVVMCLLSAAQWGPRTSSICLTWELGEMRTLRPTPDSPRQNQHLNKIPGAI